MEKRKYEAKNLFGSKKVRTFARAFEGSKRDELSESDPFSRCSAVGSVPGLGPGCRRFESCHLDQIYKYLPQYEAVFLLLQKRIA